MEVLLKALANATIIIISLSRKKIHPVRCMHPVHFNYKEYIVIIPSRTFLIGAKCVA